MFARREGISLRERTVKMKLAAISLSTILTGVCKILAKRAKRCPAFRFLLTAYCLLVFGGGV